MGRVYGNNTGIEREQASVISRDRLTRLEPEVSNTRKHYLLRHECVRYTVCEPERKRDIEHRSKWRWPPVGPTYKPAFDRIIIVINTGCRGLCASAGFFYECIYDRLFSSYCCVLVTDLSWVLGEI